MEVSFTSLIEAAKGITWQGVAVILACLATTCYLARLRLLNAREERAWHDRVPPEVAMARAATAAALPKLTKVPTSPIGPALMLLVFLGCAFTASPGPASSILQAHKVRRASDWLPSAAAAELARAGDVGSTKGGPVRGRPCVPVCVKPSTCVDGRCQAVTRTPIPPKPGPHSPSSDAELPAWADATTPDRPGDALLTACAAESSLWGQL